MKSITHPAEAGYKVKGSKFLSFLQPAESSKSAENFLLNIKDEHPAATHHCYAFRVQPENLVEFSQDDGEPGGTAGAPILNAMRSADLVNSILVVVRYYGGTKLGKSGLSEAYGKAAEMVIHDALLKTIIPVKQFSITYPYEQQSVIEKLKHSNNLYVIDASYTEDVTLILECPLKEIKTFRNSLDSIRHLLTKVDELDISYHINKN